MKGAAGVYGQGDVEFLQGLFAEQDIPQRDYHFAEGGAYL